MDSSGGKREERVNMEEKSSKFIDPTLKEEISVAEGAAQELLGEIEKKRIYTGTAGLVITIIAVATSCYHLAYAYLHPFFALDHRAIHWMLMSILLFSLYPFSQKRSPKNRMSVFDGVFLVASVGICVWIFIYSTPILNRAGTFLPVDVAMGTILIILVLEAVRRTTGPAVPLIAIIFICLCL